LELGGGWTLRDDGGKAALPASSARVQGAMSLPRWRGFNLLEKFLAAREGHTAEASTDGRYGRLEPYREDDFRWIADWGFDFVRLPLSYLCWSGPDRYREMDEEVLAQVDQGVELGQRYGIHVCLNFHRLPGYCVNPPPEPLSLWRDAEALDASCHYWHTFARRYRGVSPAKLSFNLFNEPAPLGDFTREAHERAVRALAAAIRDVDPERLIIADGLRWGQDPLPELADLGIVQSCRAYQPPELTFYNAPWFKEWWTYPVPTWPARTLDGEVRDRRSLEKCYAPWIELARRGMGVHCGEGGFFRFTPHAVGLRWLRDTLDILTPAGIGWALWCFRGPFGVLDSRRDDVAYEDWHGHRLDRKLLELLKEF
jgi:endoglucanase